MKTIELTEQERIAINAYLGENWGDFLQTAERYLGDDEVEDLAEKLEGE